MSERKCGEVIAPFVIAANDRPDLAKFQVIGGNGSAALMDPNSFLDTVTGRIVAGASCDLELLRDDGSKRDADILVLERDPEKIAAVDALAREYIGDELIVSTFGLKMTVDLMNQAGSPFKSTAKVFLGDRYVEGLETGERSVSIWKGFKALYPFMAPITSETLETYQLEVQGSEAVIPTAHPGATLLNYLTRSISGLRPKDEEKVGELADNILSYPEIREWVHDGPGAPTLELARILHTLRESRKNPEALVLGESGLLQINPLSMDKLYEHEFFMGSNMSDRERVAIVEAARIKSRVVHFGEKQQKLVTWWLKNIEQRIPKIVHND